MGTDIRIFAALNGLTVRFTPYQPLDQQDDEKNSTVSWEAGLKAGNLSTVEVKDSRTSKTLRTVSGIGDTKVIALNDLAETIKGKLIVLDAIMSSKRKEIEVPNDLIS